MSGSIGHFQSWSHHRHRTYEHDEKTDIQYWEKVFQIVEESHKAHERLSDTDDCLHVVSDGARAFSFVQVRRTYMSGTNSGIFKGSTVAQYRTACLRKMASKSS